MLARSRFFPSQQALQSILICSLVLANLLLAVPAVAGTNMDYSFIGFSADGRYVALEVSGMVDGLGEVVCSVDIYDLEQNKKLPDAPRDLRGGGISCETAQKAARSDLRTFGINSKILGEDLGISLAGTGGSPDGPPTWTEFTHKDKRCIVNLHETPDKGENPWGHTMVQWNIGLACGNETERMLLTEDDTNFSVKIVEARIVKDRLVLFTQTTHPDFEGPGSSPGVISALLSSTPLEGIKYSLEMIGFSDDSSLFGYWLSGTNKVTGIPEAVVRIFSVPSGTETFSKTIQGPANSDPQATLMQLKALTKSKLADLKLGNDPGKELYKSGTATSTKFRIDEKTYKVDLSPVTKPDEVNAPVRIDLTRPDNSVTTLQTATTGYNRSLNTIRLSKDNKVIAVITKFSVLGNNGEDRTYSAVFARFNSALPAK